MAVSSFFGLRKDTAVGARRERGPHDDEGVREMLTIQALVRSLVLFSSLKLSGVPDLHVILETFSPRARSLPLLSAWEIFPAGYRQFLTLWVSGLKPGEVDRTARFLHWVTSPGDASWEGRHLELMASIKTSIHSDSVVTGSCLERFEPFPPDGHG
ncbi:hypothetical protein RRG08_026630 [Elysia crispata]|uniref:Uncharacterized protein n=1 Tax=Elysia crispata TaxID=231223 RepID=A0AAE1AYC9_9GAST|nr:hypothetical protein RRG08_026630 [Elysia crispata]